MAKKSAARSKTKIKRASPEKRQASATSKRLTNKSRQGVIQPNEPARFRLTHPDRVIYPEEGITKRELAEYYVRVADWMLPQIAGRPLSLVRCPAGVSGECFFQKHPPLGLSTSVKRIKIREGTGLHDYLMVDNVEGLVALVQFGVLELHVWGSRATTSNIRIDWFSIWIPIRRWLGIE